MRTALLLLVLTGLGCARHPSPPPATAAASQPAATPETPAATQPASTPAVAADGDSSFETDVRPILKVRCAPCHEPGGKMYERMPFDRPGTITSHQEGVLRRLKEPAEHAAVEAWLRAQPSP